MNSIVGDKWLFLITAWLAFFIAAISPGPNMLAVMERAFGSGRRAAIGVAVGIASGLFIWAITTTFGMGFFGERIPHMVPLIGLLGGLYLIKLGVTRFCSMTKNTKALDVTPTTNTEFVKDLAHGFIVIASNLKVALFWISLSVVIAKSALSYYQTFLFSIACALTALAIYTIEALVFSHSKVRTVYFNSHNAIDMVFSLLFISIGFYLIWTGFEVLSGVATQ